MANLSEIWCSSRWSLSDAPASGLTGGARRVQDWLTAHGYELEVVELPDSTRTAADAARAVGCEIGQIVKSLVFQGGQSLKPVLILVSGKNRADESRLEAALGEAVRKADADFVREATGFAIGGVPPVGHNMPLIPLIDADLIGYEEIWAAAGTPFAVFRLAPAQLLEMTKGRVAAVSEGPQPDNPASPPPF
jgi:prolyl-tRNA editing enzyme YbaK/EbsC (Cys-tRNA(Pro) deacylase)